MKKRILAMAMVLCLLLTNLPLGALATEEGPAAGAGTELPAVGAETPNASDQVSAQIADT